MLHTFDKILFLDIETVPLVAHYNQLPERLKPCWDEKFERIKRAPNALWDETTTPEEGFSNCAGIYAEYGKIICISVGFFYLNVEKERIFRVKSFAGDDEKLLLANFFALVNKFMSTPNHTLCGHNIKEFDVPYICRRALINGLPLPSALQIAGKKPWEIRFIDTLELWKFGDYKNFTSLKLLTAIFDIPTPKDDIDGSQVGAVYYQTGDVTRIAAYCQKDVIATAQVYCKLTGEAIFPPERIELT